MSVVIIRDGDADIKDPAEAKVYLFDWDSDNLAEGAVISVSALTIDVVGRHTDPAIAKAVTSITRSGGTATVVMATAHGFSTGDSVTIAGATAAVGVISPYNGTFEVVVIDALTFTFTVTGAPATPATGTIVASSGLDNVSVPAVDKVLDDGSIVRANRYIVFRFTAGIKGAKYRIANMILSSEAPAQIKHRSFEISIQN